MKTTFVAILMIACSLGLFAKSPVDSPVTPFTSADMVTLQPETDVAQFQLIVTGPDGFVHQETFDGAHVPFFEIYTLGGELLADGYYNFELTGMPKLSEAVKAAMATARATGDESAIQAMRTKGRLPQGFVYTGGFRIHHGAIVTPDLPELTLEANTGRDEGSLPGNPIVTPEVSNADSGVDSDDPNRDQVFLDDLIVDGSACVGTDCVNGESFGFDTIRLKENNLRIKFQDTSTSASFPSNDWQLTANDSSNGGANKFSIDDVDGGRTPFTIEALAPTHSLYVDDGGRVGFGTSTPVVDLHVVSGNGPGLRLEQNGSSGFAPQTFDIEGNEANFFIRDVTNGSRLPFRIRPGAPTSSIDIAADGDVGIGIGSPTAPLHVRRTNGTAQLLVDDTTGDAGIRIEAADVPSLYIKSNNVGQANRTMLTLENEGAPGIALRNNAANGGSGAIWNIFAQGNDSLTFNNNANGGTEVVFAGDGEITAAGVVLTSDVNLKENFEEVSAQDILQGVVGLDITKWNFINSQEDVRHLGPMAQDFFAAFGLGKSETGINSTDANGVALASIQALHQLFSSQQATIAEKDAHIDTLVSKMSALEQRLAELEAKLADD